MKKTVFKCFTIPSVVLDKIDEICSYLYISRSEFARNAFADRLKKDNEFLKTCNPTLKLDPIPAPDCVLINGKNWFIGDII